MRLLLPMVHNARPRPAEIKVEDASDDDPAVWEFYRDGLATSYQEFRAVDQNADGAADAMTAYAANIDAWISNIESDGRMRRADVIEVARAMELTPSPSAGRAATIFAMRDRIRGIMFQFSKAQLNKDVTPW